MIKVLESNKHLTATQKRHIEAMLNNGQAQAINKTRTLHYQIIKGSPVSDTSYEYVVRVANKSAWFVGETPKWRHEDISILYTKNKS
jgi:type IV pilus biogenesis protein CpaD/CtpE